MSNKAVPNKIVNVLQKFKIADYASSNGKVRHSCDNPDEIMTQHSNLHGGQMTQYWD
jgi:hypothetical protein